MELGISPWPKWPLSTVSNVDQGYVKEEELSFHKIDKASLLIHILDLDKSFYILKNSKFEHNQFLKMLFHLVHNTILRDFITLLWSSNKPIKQERVSPKASIMNMPAKFEKSSWDEETCKIVLFN